MCEWADVFGKERESNKETGVEKGKETKRSHLYVILWLSALRQVGRRQRLGGIRSVEVWLKANEAEQLLLRGKQFSMKAMAQAQTFVLQCCCAGEPGGA